jgi:hypothetical protein
MQNREVSFFEECLTLGQLLSQQEKESLYRFLLESKSIEYKNEAEYLLRNQSLDKVVANGEVTFFLDQNLVSYISRKIENTEWTPRMRKMRLPSSRVFKVRRIQKYFAQTEVDVLSNFPLPGVNEQPDSGFGINTYPFYDLNYYSNGKGKVLGFINKIGRVDSEILKKLRTL